MPFLGEEIVAGEDIYGGSDRLLSQVTTKRGIVVKLVLVSSFLHKIQLEVEFEVIMFMMCRRVDTTNLEEVASAIGPMTKLVWLESPTNPRLQISDIRVIMMVFRIINNVERCSFLVLNYLSFFVPFSENNRDGSYTWCSFIG